VIGQVVSRYRLLKALGEGGMGVVYVAEDMSLGRHVAIKFLTATDVHYRDRFLREARALSSFSHTNIAAVYDYGETEDGRPYIVMELVDGLTLDDVLKKNGLTVGQATDVAIAVATALAEAHRHGIVHRDIKPGNVIFNERDEVKVVDFGLAKQIHGTPVDGAQTQSNVMVGTPLYLSPEQAGNRPVDERSDLFALGALLYECLTGRAAFAGDTVIEIGAQVLHFNPSPPSKINPRVPAALDRITMKALEKKPTLRYQSAAEMIQDLSAVRGKLPKDSEPIRRVQLGTSTSPLRQQRTSALTTLAETIRRPRLSIGTVVIGLAVLACAGWAAFHFSHSVAHTPAPAALELYNQGTEALRNGAYLQAAKLFEKAIALDDKFALAHARLAETWTELDYSDRARDQLVRVSTLVPNRSVYPAKDALYLTAVTATVGREFPLAIESYRQIADLSPDRPEAYADLGHAYEKNDDLKKAIESYTIATNRGPQYATAFLRLGSLYGRQQNQSGAEAAFSKAEALYQAQGNNEGRAEVFYQRGQLYNQQNKLAEARIQLQRALDSAVATENEYQRIRTLLQLSSVANTEGNRPQAEEQASQAIALAQANGMETLVANGLNDLGNVYLAHGDNPEAEKYFDQALEYARRHQLRRSEARALLSLASSRLERFGDPDKAVVYAERALLFFQQGNYRKEVSLALVIIQRADALQGNFDHALKAAEQQLALADQLGEPSQQALAHSEVGVLLVQKEQFPEALVHFQKQYEINKSLGHLLGVGFSLTNRGNVLWQLGDYDGARIAFDEAMPIAAAGDDTFKGLLAWLSMTRARMELSQDRMPDEKVMSALNALADEKESRRTAEAKTVIGLAHSLAGKKGEAKHSCADAMEIAIHVKNPELLGNTQLVLAERLLDQGEATAALSNALQAQDNLGRMGKHESEWKAWLIAARASQQAAKPAQAAEYAGRAVSTQAVLAQTWDAARYQSYLTRPDIKRYNKQLSDFSSSPKK
jgi:eukaryotic-like serine/threonine-protein kinase